MVKEEHTKLLKNINIKFDFSLAVDYFCGSIYLRPPRKKISEEAAPSPSLSLSSFLLRLYAAVTQA